MVYFSSRKQTLFVKHGKNVLSEFNKSQYWLNESIQMFLLQLLHSMLPKARYNFFSGCYLTLWSLMRIISVLWWTMNGSCCVRSLFPLSVASLGSFWPVCSSNFVVPSVQATVRWDSLGTCWENNHVFLTHHLEWSRNSLHYFIWAWNCLNARTVMTWSFTVCIYKSWPAVQCSVLD